MDGCNIPLKHDGMKCYLNVHEPTKEDWDICQVVELTSPESWQHELTVRRSKKTREFSDDEIKNWSIRLGRLNLGNTKHTLAATTQLVESVEAETRVVPHRHIKCRLPCLRPKRLNEGFSSDTFFPNVRSTRGYIPACRCF